MAPSPIAICPSKPVDELAPIAIPAKELCVPVPIAIPFDRSDEAPVPIAIALSAAPTLALVPNAMLPEVVASFEPFGATDAPRPNAIEPESVDGTTRAPFPIAVLSEPAATAPLPIARLPGPTVCAVATGALVESARQALVTAAAMIVRRARRDSRNTG